MKCVLLLWKLCSKIKIKAMQSSIRNPVMCYFFVAQALKLSGGTLCMLTQHKDSHSYAVQRFFNRT